MFTRKDYRLFIIAIAIITTAFALMAIDPEPNGFGIMTLWIAPPLLLIGFALPVIGIVGTDIMQLRPRIKTTKAVVGFAVWAIAMVTYGVTVEPTASLWDCSEFIAAAYKLQVPHTPGTPLSLLVGRMFAMLSPDRTSIALMLNISSAFFSALCAYLVFRIVYHFASLIERKASALTLENQITSIEGKESAEQVVAASSIHRSPIGRGNIPALLAAVLGSLSLVFSDTFWFSAVEAETYGIACFFLLVLFTLIIEGRELEGELRARRLILIGYVAGLSYCIHPMCVLALAVLPYYWLGKTYNVSIIRLMLLLASGLILVFMINRIVAIGIFQFAFGVDKFFVNNVGLPFYSGAALLLAGMIAAFTWIIRRQPQWQSSSWATVFLIVGFSPYVMLFVRSNHNPPIDENNPENLPMIKAYMNRESYPTSPLLYGPYFDAEVESVEAGRRVYHEEGSRYEISGTLSEYKYESHRSTILPRIYSNDPDHVAAYQEWLDLKPGQRPKFGDNLYFLFTYQIGHMYLRYLLFNFAGRESDRQGADWLRPWDSANSADSIYASKARNQYWMLPLLAGIAGAFFQWRYDRKGFIAVLSLFLITGLVLALYLNSPPIEPRERDYIYVASFIAYSIWIGLSVTAIVHSIKNQRIAIPLTSALAFGIPLLLLRQNFDDHDRSGRTFQVDNARNTLASCAPNAILFTGGDNDTFPLWYVQEVEGFRTDVRVMVLSYLNTDWYINQLRKAYYDSAPFALTLSPADYLQYGPNDVLYLQESIKEGIDARKYLTLISQGNTALRAQSSTGDYFTLLPSRKLLIPSADTLSQPVSKLTATKAATDSMRPSYLSLSVKGNYATKSVLAIIDVMLSNQWQRPMYFNYTSLNTAGLELEDHVVQEGAVYRFDPTTRTSGTGIVIDNTTMHKNLVEQANYANLSDTDVHFNYEDYTLRMISPVRQSFNTLAKSYIDAGDSDKALSVMNFAKEKLYKTHLPPTYANLEAAEILASLGDRDSAAALCTTLFQCHAAELKWQKENNRPLDNLDRFLADQASRILAALGDTDAEEQLKRLGI
ncbi:DUF2723 domain-containing protein [Chryseolinea sp. T2]|uniref:glycosyltransferase family 117 protein n=1 Tax=Chryseolinea sp. T2 TaxID=3129255 RepID=UPI003076EBA9